jgi:HEAT repeat protein
VVIDPVADAVGRLQSHHDNSRRDGAYTLGRLRDPRALPALVERLKNDGNSEVRIACATALGEIGDPRAAIYLERVTIYDKKQKVRDAAAIALTRLPREAAPPVVSSPAPNPSNLAPSPSVRPSTAPLEPESYERVPPPPPQPAFSGPGFPNNP